MFVCRLDIKFKCKPVIILSAGHPAERQRRNWFSQWSPRMLLITSEITVKTDFVGENIGPTRGRRCFLMRRAVTRRDVTWITWLETMWRDVTWRDATRWRQTRHDATRYDATRPIENAHSRGLTNSQWLHAYSCMKQYRPLTCIYTYCQ